MRGIGLFFGVAILVLAIAYDSRDGELFTGFTIPSFIFSEKEGDLTAPASNSSIKPPSTGFESKTLSDEELEREVEELYEKLNELEEGLRIATLHEPASPYAGMVTLKKGNADETSTDREYVLLTAASSNGAPVEITDWRLESYVTEHSAYIPDGARYLQSVRSRGDAPIALAPGEEAYVTTGKTPLEVSFRENSCTGYLDHYENFYPSLKKSCPLPTDELLEYDEVKHDDSECFEFVEDIKRCEVVSSTELNKAGLSGRCEAFIEEVLDYEGCKVAHDDDPDFFTGGSWRIYLGESRELWRSKKEILRLVDADGKIVDVIEY